MKTVTAFMNANRWLVQCPRHGRAGVMPAEEEFICPACYPGIIASYFALKGGKLTLHPDRSARRTARLMAESKDEIYKVEFPKDKEKIEKALEILPENRRHWEGDKLANLKANAQKEKHLLDNYGKRDKSKDGNNPAIVVTRGK